MQVAIGVIVTIALIVVAIVIAGPYAVEEGIRRALPPHMLRDDKAKPVASEPVTCLSCGAEMQPTDARCPTCGWTYAEPHGDE